MTEGEALAALQGADPARAAQAEAALWDMWCRADDPAINTLMQEGMAALGERRLPDAESLFTRIVERAPDFAEGWNKRATVRYVASQSAMEPAKSSAT